MHHLQGVARGARASRSRVRFVVRHDEADRPLAGSDLVLRILSRLYRVARPKRQGSKQHFVDALSRDPRVQRGRVIPHSSLQAVARPDASFVVFVASLAKASGAARVVPRVFRA